MIAAIFKVSVAGALLTLIYLTSNPIVKPVRAERLSIDPDMLKHLVLGQRLLTADFFWIRLVQEIDFSESKGKAINKGWSYHMLNAVTTLDPRYWMAYRAGLTVLSVLVQDIEGARVLYERAITQYPTDWPLHYRAAYHYLYEVKDCRRAADLLVTAGKLGAPPWVSSLATKLYSKEGQATLARSVIIDAIERFKGTPTEDELRERLKKLESNQNMDLSPEVSCQ